MGSQHKPNAYFAHFPSVFDKSVHPFQQQKRIKMEVATPESRDNKQPLTQVLNIKQETANVDSQTKIKQVSGATQTEKSTQTEATRTEKKETTQALTDADQQGKTLSH